MPYHHQGDHKTQSDWACGIAMVLSLTAVNISGPAVKRPRSLGVPANPAACFAVIYDVRPQHSHLQCARLGCGAHAYLCCVVQHCGVRERGTGRLVPKKRGTMPERPARRRELCKRPPIAANQHRIAQKCLEQGSLKVRPSCAPGTAQAAPSCPAGAPRLEPRCTPGRAQLHPSCSAAGSPVDPEWTPKGLLVDPRRTPGGPQLDPRWTLGGP